MFGEMQITNVQQLTKEETLDEAATKLLEFADTGGACFSLEGCVGSTQHPKTPA